MFKPLMPHVAHTFTVADVIVESGERPVLAISHCGRGIVQGQMLIPSKAGSQTFVDVTRIWSLQVRQGDANGVSTFFTRAVAIDHQP